MLKGERNLGIYLIKTEEKISKEEKNSISSINFNNVNTTDICC